MPSATTAKVDTPDRQFRRLIFKIINFNIAIKHVFGNIILMRTDDKIKSISATLSRIGESGTDYKIAQMLGVSPSTVARWRDNRARPRGKQAESLDVLYRTSKQADAGNDDAKRLLNSFVSDRSLKYLALGLAGVLIAVGLSWLVGKAIDEE
ncbi:MAG: hypothetical protein NUW37_05115 [Planctomycetes bacterium]|nr:hypothetical protein [Planctomycetota bacterium]